MKLVTSCPSFIIIPSKRQREQRNAARAASVEIFKKRRLEASSLLNSSQPSVDNGKLSTIDISDEEAESGTWFWNESANETDSDSDEGDSGDIDEEDLEEEQSRTNLALSPRVTNFEIKWNKEGERNLCRGYGKGSRRTQMRQQIRSRIRKGSFENVEYPGTIATKSIPRHDF